MYRRVREGGDGPETWVDWVDARDILFADHPQSPIEGRESFDGLPYFDYSPQWRTSGRFTPIDDQAVVLDHSGDGSTQFITIGAVEFALAGQECRLEMLWLDAYGGGIFLPFRDDGNGDVTYGGGRYLLDTVKGADLGGGIGGGSVDGGSLVIDLNFAYNPSCAYDPAWACPLAPPGNTLAAPVRGGELYPG